MIVDTHVHVYPPEIVENCDKISKSEPHFDLLTHNNVHKWGSAEDVLAQMDDDGVNQAWICGFAFSDIGLCRLCNDYVIEKVRNSNGRLKGLAVVPPLARGAEAEIARCHDAGLIGVGELFPQGQNLNLTDSRQTWRFVGACHEREMFLLIHTAEPVGHDYDGKGNVGPREAAQFCINHPEVTVIFAHWGGGLWLYELMPEMRLYLSNAYYDTAAWPWLYDASVLNTALAAGVGHKLLYGSDFPILSFGRYEKLIGVSGVSEEARDDLLWNNAQNVLKNAMMKG